MKHAEKLRLGTRRSPLAMAQSRQVAAALEARHGGLRVELVPIDTRGDREPGPLVELGGKGLFTREIEDGLQDGDLDLAVHSLKDLPADGPEDLALAAFPRREDCRDVLVCDVACDPEGLPEAALVLTGSLRRQAQLLVARPDLDVRSLRGNVGTRLERWRESKAAAVVLAAAGLARLGRVELPAHPLDPERFLPAPGQGTLAIQTRRGSAAEALCRTLNHPETETSALAERQIITAFGGDCRLPLGAWARESPKGWTVSAWLGRPDGTEALRADDSDERAERAADACVRELRSQGADELVAELSAAPPIA